MMKETIFVEIKSGVRSYYDLDIISKRPDEKEIDIKIWNGELKTLKLDEKKNCYVVKDYHQWEGDVCLD